MKLVEELSKELDELRALKTESLGFAQVSQEFNSTVVHCRELEEMVASLRQVRIVYVYKSSCLI